MVRKDTMNDLEHGQSNNGKKKSSTLSRILKTTIPIVISVSLVAWIYYSIEDPKDVWKKMLEVSLLPLAAMIPVSILSHLIRAWRWRRFIGEPVSVFYAITSIMIGYAVNDVLPRAGEVVRIVNMNRLTKVPVAKLLSSLLAERLLDVIVLLACLGASLMIEGELIAQHFPRMADLGPLLMVCAGAGLAGLFAVAYYSDFLCTFIGNLARRMSKKAGGKIETLIRQGAEGLVFLKNPRLILPVLIETLAIWTLYWICFILGLMAFGILTPIGYEGGFVSFSVTTVGVSVPAIGAIGTYHELGRQALSNIYTIDESLAIACITVTHFILFYILGGLGGIAAWGLQFLKFKKSEAK